MRSAGLPVLRGAEAGQAVTHPWGGRKDDWAREHTQQRHTRERGQGQQALLHTGTDEPGQRKRGGVGQGFRQERERSGPERKEAGAQPSAGGLACAWVPLSPPLLSFACPSAAPSPPASLFSPFCLPLASFRSAPLRCGSPSAPARAPTHAHLPSTQQTRPHPERRPAPERGGRAAEGGAAGGSGGAGRGRQAGAGPRTEAGPPRRSTTRDPPGAGSTPGGEGAQQGQEPAKAPRQPNRTAGRRSSSQEGASPGSTEAGAPPQRLSQAGEPGRRPLRGPCFLGAPVPLSPSRWPGPLLLPSFAVAGPLLFRFLPVPGLFSPLCPLFPCAAAGLFSPLCALFP